MLYQLVSAVGVSASAAKAAVGRSPISRHRLSRLAKNFFLMSSFLLKIIFQKQPWLYFEPVYVRMIMIAEWILKFTLISDSHLANSGQSAILRNKYVWCFVTIRGRIEN